MQNQRQRPPLRRRDLYHFILWAFDLCSQWSHENRVWSAEQKARCYRLRDVLAAFQVEERADLRNGRSPVFRPRRRKGKHLRKGDSRMFMSEHRQAKRFLAPEMMDYADFLFDDVRRTGERRKRAASQKYVVEKHLATNVEGDLETARTSTVRWESVVNHKIR